ncbi:MAG: cytochrome c [Planctomycetota bacterium]
MPRLMLRTLLVITPIEIGMLALCAGLFINWAPPESCDPSGPAAAEPENVLEFAPGVLSGAMPHKDEGFDALRGMGVVTVISVDGARPDVERASERGMRYVHLPIGYDGITGERVAELARAIRDGRERGVVYVHCHHGTHRGPAAAAAALVALWACSVDDGLAMLDRAGTSAAYSGLFEAVRAAVRVTPDEIEAVDADFPEIATVSGLVAGMAAIDRHWDHLEALRVNGWRAPADHPDLVAVAEAGIVADYLRTLSEQAHEEAREEADDEADAWHGEAFGAELTAARVNAEMLEAVLERGDIRKADAHFGSLASRCDACHAAYRDGR